MGGIADYSGALVLQLPLSCATTVTIDLQEVPRCDITTHRGGATVHSGADLALLTGALREPAALRRWIVEQSGDLWPAYVLGVVQWCLLRHPAPRTPHGFRLDIASTVPEGSGVSSSAALEVATMRAMLAALGRTMTDDAIATACQWVENYVVGAPCGIMDQMTSACGRPGQLLRLRCQPATIEGYVPIPSGYHLHGIDSGYRHAIAGADYAIVRNAAFDGLRRLEAMAGTDSARWGGYLANVSPDEYLQYEDRLPEAIRAATRHPVFEQPRIEGFLSLLGELPGRPDAAIEMGRLMRGSHDSYGACGRGSEGTDRLVELVDEAGPARGVFGARITGGGSGGTVALLGTAAAEPLVREIAARYARETGRGGSIIG